LRENWYRQNKTKFVIIVSNKFKDFISSIAPGFFMVGYVIGTGSVTTMAVSGARFGMSLTWALLLSCLFTAFIMIAISRLTIVSGNTLIYNFRNYIHPALGIFMVATLTITIVSSIIGITAIVTEVFQEWTKPITKNGRGISPILSSIVLLGTLYALYWNGKHKTFIRFLTIMVALMAFCFILTMVIVIPDFSVIANGLIPGIPEVGEPHLVIAGMVGTTMAGVCLVSRSTIVKERGWKLKDLYEEKRDTTISMGLTFLVSAAIIASAAGTLHQRGIYINDAIEMLYTLEPLVGDLAISVFAIGILCAGFSSIFPNMVMLPWLLNDYNKTERKLKSKFYRILVLIIAFSGLLVPIFGGKPVAIMIISQAVSPLVMPVLIGSLFYLINNKKVVGNYKPGKIINAAILLTFVFSVFMAVISFQGFASILK
jgi:manganese transport protein